MTPSIFRVVGFSKESLAVALSGDHAPVDEVVRHTHLDYLAGYLDRIGAKSVVVEHPYVDADYLDDYTAYYARCFADYGRWCKRIHFFSLPPKSSYFANLFDGADAPQIGSLQNAYLGFIVSRPLPEALIGRTVLRTFGADAGRRFFPATKRYEANLCGRTFTVESLAFQEQDSVLAACATVALWSCFHKTSELFSTQVPRPAYPFGNS
jgi:hypothetical protein